MQSPDFLRDTACLSVTRIILCVALGRYNQLVALKAQLSPCRGQRAELEILVVHDWFRLLNRTLSVDTSDHTSVPQTDHHPGFANYVLLCDYTGNVLLSCVSVRLVLIWSSCCLREPEIWQISFLFLTPEDD